jgi:hypothetical protein
MRRFLLLFALLLPAATAWAQTGDLLAPMTAEDAAAYHPGHKGEPAERLAPVQSEAVTSAPLQSASLAGYGTLTGKKGGLSSSLWQGTEGGVVIPLLDQTYEAVNSGTINEYVLRDLARRVALTHASEPENNPSPGTDFFAGRVMLAAAAGDPEGALELAKTNPAFIDEENAQRLSAHLLMHSKVVEACADPKLQAPATPYWQKLSVICALGRPGGKAQAQLALDIMREGGESDALFLEMAEQAASGKKKLSVKTAPGGMHVLHAALLAVTGLPPTGAMLEPLSVTPYPLLLHVKGPESWRAKMALELAKTYAATSGTLKNLFSGFVLNDKITDSLAANPKNLANTKVIAVSLRAPYALRAAETASPKAKLALLSLLISQLAPEDLAGALGQLIMEEAPLPDPNLTEGALPVARLAMLQASRYAKDWYALAEQHASLAPLAAIRGLLPESDWATALMLYAKESSVPLERRAGALGLLEALGHPVGEKAASTLAVLGSRLPEAADDHLLRNALEKKAEGEALLRTLLLSPPDTISVLLLRIKALRAVGFEREAVELALASL